MVDYGLSNEENGEWRRVGSMKSVTDGLRNQKNNNSRKDAIEIRDKLMHFFCNEGNDILKYHSSGL